MGATAVPSAVTVGRIAAVLGRSWKMIEQLNGEIASQIIETRVMLTDNLQTGLVKHLAMVGEGVLQGGVAKMSGLGCL